VSRTRVLRRVLTGGLALTALTAVGVIPSSAAGTAGPAVSAGLDGSFAFHACPSGTPAADVCATDDLSGTLPGLGAVTGAFELHIAFSEAAADHCQPIDKHGTLTTSDGHRLSLRAEGMFCNGDSGIASYNYRVVSGGTGHGQWLVPAPTTFTGSSGTGPEYFFGSLRD
jgi:hypothetical protein